MTDLATIRILLVEDNPDDAEFFIKAVKKHDAEINSEIIHAENLSDALNQIATNEFSIVVSDLNLTDSQGLETFEAIHKAAGSIPVIVLTGHGDLALALKAVEAGAADFINKQTMNGNLTKAIFYAVARKAARDRLNKELVDYIKYVFSELETKIKGDSNA